MTSRNPLSRSKVQTVPLSPVLKKIFDESQSLKQVKSSNRWSYWRGWQDFACRNPLNRSNVQTATPRCRKIIPCGARSYGDRKGGFREPLKKIPFSWAWLPINLANSLWRDKLCVARTSLPFGGFRGSRFPPHALPRQKTQICAAISHFRAQNDRPRFVKEPLRPVNPFHCITASAFWQVFPCVLRVPAPWRENFWVN